jgi:hypothetical protein
MLSQEEIGLLSGGLVFASILPYGYRTYQGKIRPVPTSWSLWALIGLALLLTYKSSGAVSNLWPALFGFINPALITILSILRRQKWRQPNRAEQLCFLFGLVSLVMWLFLRRSPELAPYALYVALVADLCAALPTVHFVWTNPAEDRPFPWVLFGCGYFLAIFAAPQTSFASWGLPLYMTAISFTVAAPLALYRARKHLPLTEWI